MSHTERKVWSQEEDDAIQDLVDEFGDKNWILIAEKLVEKFQIQGRTGKQCRERWHNHIDPGLKKAGWTKEEENILFQKQKIFGNRWSEIARYLPGRSDNSIKNQFYSTVRKNLRKYNRNKPTDKRIVGSLKQLLQNPEIAKILITYSGPHEDLKDPDTKKSKKNKNLRKASINTEEVNNEASSILQSLYDDSKEKTENPAPPKLEKIKELELKIDSATPIASLNSTTPLIGQTSTFRGAHVFNFPEDSTMYYNWDGYNAGELDGIHGPDSQQDSMPFQKFDSLQGSSRSETLNFLRQMQSPHANTFILPPFSPMDSFQHYLSPRNNK
ncbi:unnamed protein product [Blepharisma stoltei]|uniref:Myb-like DNA-binding domain containing protein n=1 Tax=Blepharisma stoltei TaxID=1481888 RepID=A0AAU9IA63_9CILI|nr:unnamed protein product [Blepharisma stoltei]